MKQYPNLQDYNLVVENLGSFGRLDLLERAVPARGTGNRLIAYSGGYSRVYRMHLDGSSFALRCWTAEVPEALERYRCIDGFMRGRRPQSFVGFSYHEDALIVRGNLYSVLWMDWVEGETLRSFVNRHMGDGAVLEDLARRFLKMVRDLHDLGVSHGDLQDENILVQMGSDAQPDLRLIDYDSVFVPGL
ncbi:MAG TPA: lipopolysaccharide kinase InaA family protein, partial [Longimicrobium sp.]|nr:lipopolysaccharide kinase InaA family protein [Longimicrobium sp.]